MQNYNINIFFSEDDEGYIADMPDLKFCSAFGKTPQDALRELMIAKKLWLEEAEESGVSVPEARYKPVIYQMAQ
jgi:predicted RNase H-like HicB family nuclease